MAGHERAGGKERAGRGLACGEEEEERYELGHSWARATGHGDGSAGPRGLAAPVSAEQRGTAARGAKSKVAACHTWPGRWTATVGADNGVPSGALRLGVRGEAVWSHTR